VGGGDGDGAKKKKPRDESTREDGEVGKESPFSQFADSDSSSDDSDSEEDFLAPLAENA
jgi:hypothetical protein